MWQPSVPSLGLSNSERSSAYLKPLQAIDIEMGPPEDEPNLHGHAKPPKHPAVAYLSRLRSKKPEGSGTGPFANRRKTLNFMTGGFLGGVSERNRRSDVRPLFSICRRQVCVQTISAIPCRESSHPLPKKQSCLDKSATDNEGKKCTTNLSHVLVLY